tara:strand:+ start:232 stop:402 length:171 start_codon:yes stop_codon:yes gene_type:complete
MKLDDLNASKSLQELMKPEYMDSAHLLRDAANMFIKGSPTRLKLEQLNTEQSNEDT